MSRHGQPRARRWAVSFADLALLIACTLMLGWRPAAADSAGAREAAVLVAAPVAALFVDDEAMLSAAGAARLARARAALGRDGTVEVRVGTGATRSARLDAWELAAARTAVLGRALGGERVVLAAPDAGAEVRIARLR